MQGNSARFTTGTLLNFLDFIKNYTACRPAACKKFQQSQLGWLITVLIPFSVLFKNSYDMFQVNKMKNQHFSFRDGALRYDQL